MRSRFVGVFFFVPLMAFVSTAVVARDRHVYLDTDGNGQLNDCPNPAHNARGANNTSNLEWCDGGGAHQKVIGTAPGRVTSGACVENGGTVRPLRNGGLADVDGDASPEPVFGHPQSCVYNMAQSDSCEVHSGTYRKVGAYCDEDCGPGVALTLDACDRGDCWRATVVAFGQGPNLGTAGYGTAGAPGYLRGADSNGSLDTWDSDHDKIPDTEPGEPTSYPVVFSGDVNSNGAFDTTTCAGNSCQGDAFYGVIIGCGGSAGYGAGYCASSMPTGHTYTKIDHDADGVADLNYGTTPWNATEAHHLVIRDIEFREYNGGNGASSGARVKEGLISLEGNDDSTNGLTVDHVYVHHNDYTLTPSRENYWAAFADSHNSDCTGHTEIKNSFIVQTNEKVLDDDCSPISECGCPKSFHDNRVLVDIQSVRKRNSFAVFAYLKSIDSVQDGTRKKDHRFFNNEFILNSTQTKFWDIQEFGDDNPTNGPGRGEIWFYGNIVRDSAPGDQALHRFWPTSCTGTVGNLYSVYFFNNTFDTVFDTDDDGLGEVCDVPGKLIVERNDAYYQPHFVHSTAGTTVSRAREVCSTSSGNPATCTVNGSGRAAWFLNAASSALYGGLMGYVPQAAGPLNGRGTCDPDGDGQAGVDYDGDGINDTSWRDIAGNLISCPSIDSTINIGAIQASSVGPSGTPPEDVTGVHRTDRP